MTESEKKNLERKMYQEMRLVEIAKARQSSLIEKRISDVLDFMESRASKRDA